MAYSHRWYRTNKKTILTKHRAYKGKLRKEYQERVNRLKAAPCVDCKKRFNPWVMQFDHIGSDKEFNVSTAAGQCMKWSRILKEIEKCELVCANCHAERTHSRKLAA